MPWFWEKFDAAGWSLWKMTYNYNEENKQGFMTSNAVNGFMQRCEEVRKYAFGAMAVLGAAAVLGVAGVFILVGAGRRLPGPVGVAQGAVGSVRGLQEDRKRGRQKEAMVTSKARRRRGFWGYYGDVPLIIAREERGGYVLTEHPQHPFEYFEVLGRPVKRL